MLPKVEKDGIHCNCTCPHLKEKLDNRGGFSATCGITGKDLIFYDFWIAMECALMIILKEEEEINDSQRS